MRKSSHFSLPPQLLGAISVIDTDPELAANGIRAYEDISTPPTPVLSPTPNSPKLPQAEYIDKVVTQMQSGGCSPQQIGKFIASQLEDQLDISKY